MPTVVAIVSPAPAPAPAPVPASAPLIAEAESLKEQMLSAATLMSAGIDGVSLKVYTEAWLKYAAVLQKIKDSSQGRRMVVELGRQALILSDSLEVGSFRQFLLYDQSYAVFGACHQGGRPYCPLIQLTMRQSCPCCGDDLLESFKAACLHMQEKHPIQCQDWETGGSCAR